MEELQVIETTSGRQFKPWATKDDVQDPASVTAVASEIASGKQAIAAAINAKGGSASATESFSELAQDIQDTPTSGVLSSGIVQSEPFSFLDYICRQGAYPFTEIDNDSMTVIDRERGFYNHTRLLKVNMSRLTTISGSRVFENCSALQEIEMPNLTTISGSSVFQGCASLTKIQMDNLRTMVSLGTLSSLEEFYFPNVATLNNAELIWTSYPALKRIILPSLSHVNGQGYRGFFGGSVYISNLVVSMKLGTVVTDLVGNEGFWNYLRNFEVGYGTNANINFKLWRATNVIAEGAVAIAELNANIMNGIVANILQGAGKTFTVGSTLYNVLYPDTLQAFADKGWNIASA